jgi:L-talarate/galactarate dehydratase
MKVAQWKTRVLQTPADNPLVVGVPQPGTREFVLLELDTDEGIQGIGVTFFGGPLTPALRAAVDSLCELTIGEDPMQVEAVADRLRQVADSAGPEGIFTLALAAVDMALWDIKGKALDQPVCSLLGGHRSKVSTYASGALMRPFNLEYLAEAGPRLVEMGFKQMKTQMGAEPTPEREVARIRTLRDAIGPDIDLMCDINQLWSVNQAIDIGKRVEEYYLFWLEDVVVRDDYQGLARVADALTTPIAAGEYVYGIRPFRHMLEHRSVDIVMIDLLRVGGITQFRKVAGMAEAFNLPVVSHLIPEIQVHNVAAIPNGLTVEYMPWTLRLYEETPAIKDGEIVVPDKPGLGLKFSQDAIRQYQIS